MRLRELIWIDLCLLLAGAYVSENDYIDQKVIEERHQQIARCQKVQEQHAKNLTTLLDRGGVLYVSGEPVVMCKRKGL